MHPNWFVVLVIALACAPLLAALGWVTTSRRRDARRARIAERMGAAYESEPEPAPEPVLEQASRDCDRESHASRHPDGECDCWDDTAVYYLRGGVPLAPRQEPLRSSSPLPPSPPVPPRVRVPIAAATPPPPAPSAPSFPPAQTRQTQPVRPAPPVPPADPGGSGRARPPQTWHTGRHERLPVGVATDAAQQRWAGEYAEPVRRPRHRLDD